MQSRIDSLVLISKLFFLSSFHFALPLDCQRFKFPFNEAPEALSFLLSFLFSFLISFLFSFLFSFLPEMNQETFPSPVATRLEARMKARR